MHELLGGRPGRLLDVACGSGRHAREFAALGWDVTGVDYSPDLLARAREAGIAVHEQDMRKLDVPGAPFDAVTCLFDSIGYPQDNDGIVAALAGMRRHGRRVAVEFLHAPALLAHADPVRVRRFELPDGGELLRVSETTLDEAAMVMHVELRRARARRRRRRTRRETRAPVEPLLRGRGDARADAARRPARGALRAGLRRRRDRAGHLPRDGARGAPREGRRRLLPADARGRRRPHVHAVDPRGAARRRARLAARVRLLRDRDRRGPAAGRDDDARGQASPPRRSARSSGRATRRTGSARRASAPKTWFERSLAEHGVDLVWFATNYAEDCDQPFIFTVFDVEHARQPWYPGGERRGRVGAAPPLLLALHPEGDARDRAELGRARPGRALLAHRAGPLPAARPSDARVRARGRRAAGAAARRRSTATASASATCSIRRSSGRTRTTRRCSTRSRCSTASSSCWSAPTRASSSTTGGSRASSASATACTSSASCRPTSWSRSTGTPTRSPT